MIDLFKPNDPFRLILGLLLFIILTLPIFLWAELPNTSTMVVNDIIGNKIRDGFWLYRDIWDYSGLLNGFLNGLIHFSKNTQIIANIIAMITLFFIGAQTAISMNKNEVYGQKNYLTLYFFILSIFASFTILQLSAQLMSLLFLSLALHIVLKHFSGHLHDEDRILLGLWHGIASLFYFPSTIFFVLHLLFFAAFTKLKATSYLLSIFGFIAPYFFICIFYYTNGSLFDFMDRGIFYYFYFNFRPSIGFENIMILALPLISTIVFAYFSLFSQNHNNIQSTSKALMLMWLFCITIIIFWTNFDVYNLCYLTIPFAYFCTYMFLTLRNQILKRVLSFLIPLFLIIGFWSDQKFPMRSKPEKPIISKHEAFGFTNKKVLVLGDEINKYNEQRLGSKYFYWPMAQKHFKKTNTYAGITLIYTSLMEDKPEIIFDEINLMPILKNHIPILNEWYKTTDHKIYYLQK